MNMLNARHLTNFHACVLFRPEYLHFTVYSLHMTNNFSLFDELA